MSAQPFNGSNYGPSESNVTSGAYTSWPVSSSVCSTSSYGDSATLLLSYTSTAPVSSQHSHSLSGQPAMVDTSLVTAGDSSLSLQHESGLFSHGQPLPVLSTATLSTSSSYSPYGSSDCPHDMSTPTYPHRSSPSIKSVCAMYFPMQDTNPVIQLVDFRLSSRGTAQGPHAFIDDVMPVDNGHRHSLSSFLIKEAGGVKLACPFRVWYYPNATEENKTISRLTNRLSFHHWNGPFLVMKYRGHDRLGFIDVVPEDLPTITDIFMWPKPLSVA